jgi:hypothetical protein
MRKPILAIAALWLTACSSPDPPPPQDQYVGRPVSKLALQFGPPVVEVDSGNNQRTFFGGAVASSAPPLTNPNRQNAALP